jgi:hypothetical protein
MKRQLVLTVSAVVLAMSGGLFLMAGERVAQAAPPDKSKPNQSWDENQTGTARFTVLSAFGGAAVRDNNTGLVWEQAPEATQLTWAAAAQKCINKAVGGTVGWRLPSVVELKSVQDPSLPQIAVPVNIFTGVLSAFHYWSATTVAADPLNAWVVRFDSVETAYGDKNIGTIQFWCVRGGMNADAY